MSIIKPLYSLSHTILYDPTSPNPTHVIWSLYFLSTQPLSYFLNLFFVKSVLDNNFQHTTEFSHSHLAVYFTKLKLSYPSICFGCKQKSTSLVLLHYFTTQAVVFPQLSWNCGSKHAKYAHKFYNFLSLISQIYGYL